MVLALAVSVVANGLVVQWQDGPMTRYPPEFKSWCLHLFFRDFPVLTSRISRSVGAQSFGGAHRGRVCVRVFIGVSVHVCYARLRCTV
jgi:hypothetical protein